MVVYTIEQRWEVSLQSTYRSFCQKKIIFSDEAHFDLGGYVPFRAQKTHTHTLKSLRTQNKSLFGVNFRPETKLCHFYSKMSKGRPLQSMVILIGPCWTNFCSQKLNRRILATFGFNRMALRATQPKLQSMCFWRSHYQPHFWFRVATSELQFDTVGLLFVGCRQR